MKLIKFNDTFFDLEKLTYAIYKEKQEFYEFHDTLIPGHMTDVSPAKIEPYVRMEFLSTDRENLTTITATGDGALWLYSVLCIESIRMYPG